MNIECFGDIVFFGEFFFPSEITFRKAITSNMVVTSTATPPNNENSANITNILRTEIDRTELGFSLFDIRKYP